MADLLTTTGTISFRSKCTNVGFETTFVKGLSFATLTAYLDLDTVGYALSLLFTPIRKFLARCPCLGLVQTDLRLATHRRTLRLPN